MAHDDRTEKPTPKRKREARRKGQVAKSPDVSAWLIMLAATVLVPRLLGSAGQRLEQLWAQVAHVITDPTQAGAIGVLNQGLNDAAALILPTVGACAVIGMFANVAQTGLMLSGHNAAPKWDRLNPLAGAKRLLSTQSLWELAKQAVKLVTLVGVAYGALSGLAHTLVGVQPVNMTPVVAYTGAAIMSLIQKVAALGLVLALADYAWSKRKLNRSLKMTKHEVKEEARQSDGDPHVKGQVRRRMYKLSRSRMMAAVAGADVVVVNPTHFAVALRYERERGGAPIVVAKGADEMALRIREEGQKHRVPVVEDPPLARAVYAACDIDDAIPAELFLAVARLLAFVFTLNPILRAAGLVHRRPISALVA